MSVTERLPLRHLMLATFSFAVCFMSWGMIAALAPLFRTMFALNPAQTGLLIATPVLLGSVARIPLGLLTDRFGGRSIFSILLVFVAVALLLVPLATSYSTLLGCAFLLGFAGASFSVGIGYVSRWTPIEMQGRALGIYGTGNIGQSVAVLLAPMIAASAGWISVFHGAAAVVVVVAVCFAILARDAPAPEHPVPLLERPAPRPKISPPRGRAGAHAFASVIRMPRAWALALFYFLTFGGFVAFSIYLPTMLVDKFSLSPTNAGFRAAGFVILATVIRPVGGWLADRIGGAHVLSAVLPGIAPFALLLTWPSMIPFTVGALGCAALMGVGNGAIFKLVPEHFPTQTGTVAGLVGAVGGLGGFFPPLLIGFSLTHLGSDFPAFALLAATAILCWSVNDRLFLMDEKDRKGTLSAENILAMERLRGGAWATLVTGMLGAAIVVGSRNLAHFDAALVIYTFAVIFATWGITYHYFIWLQKPPTHMYWRRSWEIFYRAGVAKNLVKLAPMIWSQLFSQDFIRKRSMFRWLMHQFLFWGCLLAAAITFPLVFGWIHFGTPPDHPMTYVVYVFGFPTSSFHLLTIWSWLIFHGLDFAAVLVLTGIALALWRRMRDQGALAVQDFGRDFFPLILLFAVSISGLALTVSATWLRGSGYGFLSLAHAVTVIATLLFLPFGKFFHIFQRPAQLGVKLYHESSDRDGDAACDRCGGRVTSRQHLADLKIVLVQLDFDYRTDNFGGNWQNLCPACKRKSIASAQLRLKAAARG